MLFSNVRNGQVRKLSSSNYDIYKEHTSQAEYAVSNNDKSVKNIAVYVNSKKNFVLDGMGAQLMFHDRITPFLLDKCENVTLRNFSIDYDRPFFTQGTILESDNCHVVLHIHPEYPFRVQGKNLIMTAACWENDLQNGIMLFQEFNVRTKAPAYNADVRIYRIGEQASVDPTAPLPMGILTVKQMKSDVICLEGDLPCYTVGNELIMTHEFRHNSGIVLHRCKNIRLENIQIIHTGAMGVVAQLSENIHLEKICVSLGNHPMRFVSTNCDATHFVACSGRISFQDCILENMMDDGINVHGVYTCVEKVIDEDTLETRIMHFQQFAVSFYQKGDIVRVTAGNSSDFKCERIVKTANPIREDLISLHFESQNVKSGVICNGDFLENQSTTPELFVDTLKTGHNRPRGILATTPRPVCIQNSVFYNSGYGVHIAGNICFWYEAGAVRNVNIQGCTFLDCNYNTGDYAIAITPEFAPSSSQSCFHSNIAVVDNHFEGFTDGAVLAQYVNGLSIKGNTFHQTQSYPKRIHTKRVSLCCCKNVNCEEDTDGTL